MFLQRDLEKYYWGKSLAWSKKETPGEALWAKVKELLFAMKKLMFDVTLPF